MTVQHHTAVKQLREAAQYAANQAEKFEAILNQVGEAENKIKELIKQK